MTRIHVNELKPNSEIITEDPILEIFSDDGSSLPVGPHRFQLRIRDAQGNESNVVTVEVTIVDTQAPTAVLDVLPSDRLEPGQPFMLSAERSEGIRRGESVQYIWMLTTLGR